MRRLQREKKRKALDSPNTSHEKDEHCIESPEDESNLVKAFKDSTQVQALSSIIGMFPPGTEQHTLMMKRMWKLSGLDESCFDGK